MNGTIGRPVKAFASLVTDPVPVRGTDHHWCPIDYNVAVWSIQACLVRSLARGCYGLRANRAAWPIHACLLGSPRHGCDGLAGLCRGGNTCASDL